MKLSVKCITYFGVICVCLFPYILTRDWGCIKFGEATGAIGDTIGGTTAPVVGVLSIILLYFTLSEQMAFNKRQQEAAVDEQFKSTLFNLLLVQRDILNRISGSFSYLGLFTYDELPDNSKEIKILKNNKEWLVVKEPLKREVYGIEFFKEAKYQLKLIYKALGSKEYYNGYDAERAFEDEQELREKIIVGCNIPPEVEKEQNELIETTRNSHRFAYINDKYGITRKAHDVYQRLSEEKKVGLGYAYFYYKYEGVGYYFRHLYQILKFIKRAEDEKIENLGKSVSDRERGKVHDYFKEYAQFVQSQMSIEELLLLYYNSFMFKKTQELIIYYDLLENLTLQNLIMKEHYCNSRIIMKDKKNFVREVIEP